MTVIEIVQHLKSARDARQTRQVSRDTKVPYNTLRRLLTEETLDPRSSTVETLREYFSKKQ